MKWKLTRSLGEKSWNRSLILERISQFTFLLFALTFTAGAQQSVNITLSNGVRLRVDTSIGQPDSTVSISTSMLPASGNSFFRVFRDQNNLAVYAYELVVDRPDGTDEFHLAVRPAGERFQTLQPQADLGKPVPTVSDARDLGILRSGEPLRFAVFHLPGSGVDVVDTVQLDIDSQSGGGRFKLDGMKVYMNSNLAAPAATGSVSGRFAMFYLPGRGGFFLSSEPVQGKAFVEAGWVDRAHMLFTLENVVYDCSANSAFLTGTDRGEVWVYHDPNFKPAGNWTKPLNDPADLSRPPQFYTAAANTLSWWIQ